MPFIKDFVDPETGASFPGSYWWPNDFSVNYGGRSITATYLCHVSEAAQAAGKRPLPYSKQYRLEGAAFVALLQQIAQLPPSDPPVPLPLKIAALLDTIALQVADQPVFNEQGQPVLVNGTQSLQSFFTGAQQIQPDLAVLSAMQS